MSIIINDFEVVVEPPSEPESQTTSPKQQAELPPPLRPEEIFYIQRWYKRRLKRVWAD